MRLRRGDLVVRISYNKDIIFRIDRIIKLTNGQEYAILKGITARIEADAPLEDIEKAEELTEEQEVKVLDFSKPKAKIETPSSSSNINVVKKGRTRR